MRLFIATLIIAIAAVAAFGQAPTLRIVTEDPNLPSELFYGNVKVKPLRLRPGTNTPITINDSDFFVTQQYVDFLSRFPDQSGFNFWNNEITSCGADAACIENKRINVSAAFFLSIEYHETGYLVYKMYEAGFGNLPGKPVPVRREDFVPDTKTIGSGLVVGAQGWEDVLNNNKNAFALAFVQRPAFVAAFPASMTATQFVDKLDANIGNVLNSTDKANLVSILGASPSDNSKRAQVVRAVAENSTLDTRDFNKAFVLTQYFGYLRRNPDEGNDTNFDGFNFWLGKLNQFNGNYVQAEMVKAFLVSGEYLNRF
ncbi:MAG TPA: hypothetical protein VI306_17400 [Pyrinomonadaceae bacterium]